MEDFIQEKDLLGDEETRVTRKNLLPKWFYIMLAIFTLFLAYGITRHCISSYNWYMAMNVETLSVDELSGMWGGLITHLILVMIKMPVLVVGLGIFLQKKKAAVFAIVLFTIHFAIEFFGATAQLYTYLQYDFPLNTFALGFLPGSTELITVWIMIGGLRKVRKQWPLAVPSNVQT